jgi:hypothetical protein
MVGWSEAEQRLSGGDVGRVLTQVLAHRVSCRAGARWWQGEVRKGFVLGVKRVWGPDELREEAGAFTHVLADGLAFRV